MITSHSSSVTSVWYRLVSRICCFRVVGVHMATPRLVSATPWNHIRPQPLNPFRNGLLDACMKSEQASRDAIAAIWKEIPPSYKASCIDPRAYSASYIEWIACLELYIDVKKQRSN